jgi:hypothetical protein
MNSKPACPNVTHWPDTTAVVLGFVTPDKFLACGLMTDHNLTDQLRQLKQWRVPMLHNKNMLCKLQYHDLEHRLLRRQAKTQCNTVALRIVHAPSCVAAMFVLNRAVQPPMIVTVRRVEWSLDKYAQFVPKVFTKELRMPLVRCTTEQVLKMDIGPGSLLQVMDNCVIKCVLRAPKGASLPEYAILSRNGASPSLIAKPKSLRAQHMCNYMARLGLPDVPLQPCITLLKSGYSRLGDWLTLTTDKVRAIRNVPSQFADHFAHFDVEHLSVVDLMYASGLFDPMSKLKLCLVIQHCGTRLSEACLKELLRVDSISPEDAQAILRGITKFIAFVAAEDLARWCWPPARIMVTRSSEDDVLSTINADVSCRATRGATM